MESRFLAADFSNTGGRPFLSGISVDLNVRAF